MIHANDNELTSLNGENVLVKGVDCVFVVCNRFTLHYRGVLRVLACSDGQEHAVTSVNHRMERHMSVFVMNLSGLMCKSMRCAGSQMHSQHLTVLIMHQK